MRLVFCFITNYRNIHNQAFDFGSEYIYSAQVKNKYLHINRQQNKQYITEFYKNDYSGGFENITAIVGENGSGKSSLLTYLSQEFFDNNNIAGKLDIIVPWDVLQEEENNTQNSKKEINKQRNESRKQIYDVLLFSDGQDIFIKTANTSRVKTNFKDKLKNFSEGKIDNIGAIFYSPIYDFTHDYVYRNNHWYVDVSSNFLVRNDGNYHDDLSGFGDKTIEIHKFQNTYRQLDFIINAGENASIGFLLPKDIIIRIYPNELPEKFDYQKLWNTDRSLQPLYEKVYKLWHDETEKLFSEVYKAEDRFGTDSQQYLEVNKQLAKKYAYYYLAGVLFMHLNRANHYLEGFFKDIPSIETIDTLRDLIVIFVNSQTIISSITINLLDDLDEVIENATEMYKVNGLQVLNFRVPIHKLFNFVEDYRLFLSNLPNIGINSPPTRFIQFDWGYELSSGQRAFIDLFSRFYFGVQQLLDRQNLERNPYNKRKKLPENIYLLIDEGELGFHLQWQKEYIYNLITYLPKIVVYSGSKKQNKKPALHLVVTTHSPISLSDIAQYNIIYMSRENDTCMVVDNSGRPSRSFGANIYDLMHDAFFIKEGFIGKFAHEKIDKIIEDLISDEPLDDSNREYINKLINLVDDPIIKVKLKELYAQKLGLNAEEERLLAQMVQIQRRLSDINKKRPQ